MTAISHQPKRKDLMIEARFLPANLEEAQQLREVIRQVIERGDVAGISPAHAESVADAMTGWLIGKRHQVDQLSSKTRARYRKVLQELEAQVPGGGQRGRVHRPGIIGVLAGTAGAMAAAVATGNSAAIAAAGVAMVAAPIIYERPGCVVDLGAERVRRRGVVAAAAAAWAV